MLSTLGFPLVYCGIMPVPGLKIHHKIVIPFAVLLVAATLVTAFISVTLISENLERRFQTQLENASKILAQIDFAVTGPVLERLKLIIGAEIVTYAKDGGILAGTLSPSTDAELLALIQTEDVLRRIFSEGEELILMDVVHRGVPYKVAYRPIRFPSDAVIAFVADTSDMAQAKRAVARNIGLLAAVMIPVLVLISQLIARSITKPVHELVAHTKTLAAGELTRKADVTSHDEIGELASAFNEMADQLRESEEKLLRSEKLAVTGQLAARVAHDIRNPLSAMKMQAQLLRNKLQPGEANETTLQAILSEIDRVEWVVQGLLDLGRPVELRLKPGSINVVVEDALAATKARLVHGKIRPHLNLGSDVPNVELDPDRLKQALLNIIMNAAEAMPVGGNLRVATISEGDSVRIEITDNGEGIVPEDFGKLFDPFFTTKRDGVGLGLVNTRSIVERHGGRIDVEPASGKGTRVIITLPAVATE